MYPGIVPTSPWPVIGGFIINYYLHNYPACECFQASTPLVTAGLWS